MKINWATTLTLGCFGLFVGTVSAQKVHGVGTTPGTANAEQTTDRSKTETTSTKINSANRRVEDAPKVEQGRPRVNPDVANNGGGRYGQSEDQRGGNNGGYRKKNENDDHQYRDGGYASRDAEKRAAEGRGKKEECSSDKHHDGESHGYSNASRGKEGAEKYKDRDDKMKGSCDDKSKGKSRRN